MITILCSEAPGPMRSPIDAAGRVDYQDRSSLKGRILQLWATAPPHSMGRAICSLACDNHPPTIYPKSNHSPDQRPARSRTPPSRSSDRHSMGPMFIFPPFADVCIGRLTVRLVNPRKFAGDASYSISTNRTRSFLAQLCFSWAKACSPNSL